MTSSPIPTNPEEESNPSSELPIQESESASLLIPFDLDDQQFIKGYN